MKTIKLLCVAGAAVLALNGCGGGGGDPGTTFQSGDNDGDGLSDVSTTKATQKSVSFAAEDYQLDWSSNGITTSVTILVADTAGNPLPAGSKIQFSTSGGQIEKTCTTGTGDAGASGCSVTFTTANPRPSNGLVSIVAWLVGEEAYKDLNGNGKYDSGEPFYESGTLFRDDNGSGDYTPGVDELVVGTTNAEKRVGVGTSACREDDDAAPTEVPMSVPNTCDGVWGKTLVRAVSYFAISDPRRLGIAQATDEDDDPVPGKVTVFTLAPDGQSRVAAVTGTTLSVVSTLPAGCVASFQPDNTVSSTAVLPTEHEIVLTGTCSSVTSVSVRATTGSRTAQVDNVPMPPP